MRRAIAALFIFAAIGLASCSKTDVPVASNSSVGDDVSSIVISTMPPFDQYDAVNAYDGVSYATDDSPAPSGIRFPGNPDMRDKRNLSAIIRCLQFTDAQKTQIDGFLRSARDCMQSAEQPFRQVMKDLRDQHLAAVKGIRDAVQAGTMTKDQARANLRDLENSFRKSLEDARATLMTAAKECEKTLFANIESILTPDQIAKWREWRATGKIPCAGGKTRP